MAENGHKNEDDLLKTIQVQKDYIQQVRQFNTCHVCYFGNENENHFLYTFKLCLLVYKAINGLAPSYLQDLCVPVTTVYTRSALRSGARGDLVVPRTRRRLGNRAFCVAGPTAWIEQLAARHSNCFLFNYIQEPT